MCRVCRWLVGAALLAIGWGGSAAQAQAIGPWVQSLGNELDEQAAGVVVNAAGEVYAAGTFRGTVDFDPGPGVAPLTSAAGSAGFVVKFSPAGTLLWARSIQGTDRVAIQDLDIDPAGNLAVTGGFQDTVDLDPGVGTASFQSEGSEDIFVAKLNPAGDLIWGFAAGDSSSDTGRALTVDDQGDIYVTGSFEGVMNFQTRLGDTVLASEDEDDVFILRFSPDGVIHWAKDLNGGGDAEGRALAVDGQGNVLIAGVFDGKIDLDPGFTSDEYTSAGHQDIFLTKLVAGGDWRWSTKMGGRGQEELGGMVVDRAGAIYLTGSFEGAANFDRTHEDQLVTAVGARDIFLVRFNVGTDFGWVTTFGDGGSEESADIVLDPLGNLVIAGSFDGAVDFAPGDDQAVLTSAGQDDVFIAKYGSNGMLYRALAFGGPSDDLGRGVAVDGDGNAYLVGTFQQSAVFNLAAAPVTVNSRGGDDLFVAKIGQAQWTPGLTELRLPRIFHAVPAQ